MRFLSVVCVFGLCVALTPLARSRKLCFNVLVRSCTVFLRFVMATSSDKSLSFDATEKAFLQASLELKVAQVRRAIASEVDPEIIRLRNAHVGVLVALQSKIRSA